MSKELTEEEIYSNDKDPLEAIAELRRNEGKTEEEIEDINNEISSSDKSEDNNDNNVDEENQIEEESQRENAENAEGPDNNDNTDSSKESENENLDKSSENEEKPNIRKVVANGKEYEFTDQEILDQFGTIFAKAVDYTQKTQKIAPYRKMISALESENIDSDQLNLAIDALKGNKEAIRSLMEKNEIDPLDFAGEEESREYSPNNYGKEENEILIDEVIETISNDDEYKITVDVVDNQWDNESRIQLSNNPQMIVGLHNDIKTGIYDKVAPVAMKMKILDGNAKSDIEYYILAGQEVLNSDGNSEKSENNTESEKSDRTQVGDNDDIDPASSNADQKRSASSTPIRADRKGVIDYIDDDDEEYDKWYNNLMSKN